ncbi:MAG: LPS assembly lipoprotein LptE [Acidobacteriota bacterium]|nr:LPS assembly lipoprotein LptE [Acidobacteriota bacterium]
MKMLTLLLCATLLTTLSCGYKVVGWSSENYKTMVISPVKGSGPETGRMTTRLRDALIERCLAASGFTPVDDAGDLVLETNLQRYRENVVATDVDGRTLRIQFALSASFVLRDKAGKEIWKLDNYRYSDQYNISTGRDVYRDEAVFIQDNALDSIADLVIANITLAIDELESGE